MSVPLTSLALVRGLIGYIIGFVVGMIVVVLGRVLLGAEPWFAEAVYVGGIVCAIVGFLLASGVMSDWLKWTRAASPPRCTTVRLPAGQPGRATLTLTTTTR